MTCPDSVHAHVLHEFQLPAGRFFMKSCAQRTKVMMQAHAFQPGFPAVQEESLIRISENRP